VCSRRWLRSYSSRHALDLTLPVISMLITVNCLLFKKKKHEPHECVKLMVVQVGDWMEREGRVGSLGFGGLGLGGVCVCARALERREKFHGGRVRRSRHFCILAPGSDIQTGRRRHLRRCRFRKDSRPPSVRVLVRRISARLFGTHRCLVFVFFV